MSSNHQDPTIRHTLQATEYIYYPTRRSVHIQEGDWDRWIRSISKIPKEDRFFRDISFTGFGISIPSLVSAVILGLSDTGIPTWPLFIYLIIGVTSLAIGVICLLFDRRISRLRSQSVEDILEDMKDVRERSAVSEEEVKPPQVAPSFG